jgi:photosystem II stability/assembly factor-like uncharacterized protein
MQFLSVILILRYTFCLLIASALTWSCGSNPSNWQVLSHDDVSDGLPILSLNFTDSRHGLALTPTQLLETVDGGSSWTTRLEAESTERSFYSFTFVNPKTGFIVGTQRKGKEQQSLILYTTDGGTSWRDSEIIPLQSSVKNASRLHSIRFCNPLVGWAVGTNVILYTTDGGRTWEAQYISDKEEVFFSVECLSPERVYVVGQDGVILYTEDGGKYWRHQNSGTKDNLVRVRFFGNNGWIVGGLAGKGTLLRTLNGGAHWESVQLSNPGALFDIYINGSQGWLVGGKGIIFYTNDAGQTWREVKSPTDNNLICISFITPQQGWIGGSKRTILRLYE